MVESNVVVEEANATSAVATEADAEEVATTDAVEMIAEVVAKEEMDN